MNLQAMVEALVNERDEVAARLAKLDACIRALEALLGPEADVPASAVEVFTPPAETPERPASATRLVLAKADDAIVAALAEAGRLKSRDLWDSAGVTRFSGKLAVRRLIRAGLVEAYGATQSRAYALTPKGKALVLDEAEAEADDPG
ncbi:MAG: hypothetical protein AB7G23_02930 [Vicinamibacterales bacterium]